MSKTSKVLEHLQRKGTITSLEAFTKYNATRLSAIIFQLRKKYVIDTEYDYSIDEDGTKIRYGIYRLREEQ